MLPFVRVDLRGALTLGLLGSFDRGQNLGLVEQHRLIRINRGGVCLLKRGPPAGGSPDSMSPIPGLTRTRWPGDTGSVCSTSSNGPGGAATFFASVVRAFGICEQHNFEWLEFDQDGLGAGVKGDSNEINKQRRDAGKAMIRVFPYRGSGSVADPDGCMVEKRLNRDYFSNLKAQSWWSLRLRFQATYRAVVEKLPYKNPDELISIDPDLPELVALCTELSQPTWSMNSIGKITINKMPDGAKSPNLADACCIAYSPGSTSASLRTWLRLVS